MNTSEPAHNWSSGTPGTSAAVGAFSASVTWPVARTNAANAALLTSVASSQKPDYRTRCSGASASPHWLPSTASPPAIQTMPSVGDGDGAGSCAASAVIGTRETMTRDIAGWSEAVVLTATGPVNLPAVPNLEQPRHLLRNEPARRRLGRGHRFG